MTRASSEMVTHLKLLHFIASFLTGGSLLHSRAFLGTVFSARHCCENGLVCVNKSHLVCPTFVAISCTTMVDHNDKRKEQSTLSFVYFHHLPVPVSYFRPARHGYCRGQQNTAQTKFFLQTLGSDAHQTSCPVVNILFSDFLSIFIKAFDVTVCQRRNYCTNCEAVCLRGYRYS